MHSHPNAQTWRPPLRVLLAGLLLAAVAATQLHAAQDGSGEELAIEEVQFAQNRLLSDDQLSDRLGIQPGSQLGRQQIDEAVQELAAAPFLSRASFNVERTESGGARIVVTVSENVTLEEIEFHGNYELENTTLRSEVASRSGETASASNIRRDVRALRRAYGDEGYRLATIDWIVRLTDDGRGVLEFHIIEGPYCWVSHIQVRGNTVFSDETLRDQMETYTRGWLSLIWPGLFKTERFNADMRRIEQYYREHGYLDVQADGYYTHSRDFSRLTARVLVHEGEQYTLESLDFEGNTVFTDEELAGEMPLSTGEPYNPADAEESQQKIQDLYQNQGYMDVSTRRDTLQMQVVPDPDAHTVAVRFRVTEGEPVYIGRVRIQGLTKTKDHVVRRNLTFDPGERASREKMDKSERELRNTGYFDRQSPNRGVNIELEPTEEQVRDALVNVQEGQTGSIFLGGGVSSEAGFIGQFSVRERNFDIWNWPGSWRELASGNALRGGGHTVEMSARMGTERSRFLLRFRNPSVWNSDYSFGTELFTHTLVRDEYDESRAGLNASVGRKLSQDSRATLTGGYESIEMDDVDDDAARVIREDEGSYSKPYVRLSYRIDKRDDVTVPTSGYLGETSVEVSAGDIDSIELSARGRKFWTVTEPNEWGGHVLSLGGRISVLEGYGDRIPVVEKLYAGGMSTLRGFDYRGVSPADPATGDQIGGKSLLVGSAQYSVPVGTEDFRVHTFVDAGYVEKDTWDVLSGWDVLRVSTGLGFRWQAPILGGSSLGVDLAFPVMDEDEDDTRTIHFSLGAFRSF